MTYTLVGGGIFYGVSIPIAQRSDRYNEFFTTSVPLGETLVDYFTDHDLSDALRQTKQLADGAVEKSKHVYHSVADTVTGNVVTSDPREALAEARDKALRETRKAKTAGANVGHDAKQQFDAGKAKAEELTQRAKDAVAKAEEEARKKSRQLLDGAQSALAGAGEAITGAGKDEVRQTGRLVDGVQVYLGNEPNKGAVGGKTLPEGKPWPEPLPVQHEAPPGYVAARNDRGPLKIDTEAQGVLRTDPGAPRLPLLAPAISQLASTASEPVISQLAATIDDLAQLLRDAPKTNTFQAKDVLNLARADLEALTKRLEDVKKREAERVDRTLEAQKKRFEEDMRRKEAEVTSELSKKDKEWKGNLEEERAAQAKKYEQELKQELETQSEIINERLREEVIAQGVELQRRWMRDIKARVEEERGGRLAKLDELATQVQHLENVAKKNQQDQDQSGRVNTLLASVRALQTILDARALETGSSEDDAKQLVAGKKPFREELRRLEANASNVDESSAGSGSEVVHAALGFLRESSVPDEGVDSFLTLSTWFVDKVSPAVLRTALLPEHAGVLSHATSSLFAPLLFKKRAASDDSDDVPSILARAEHALQREDLDLAAREVNQLKGWGKILAQDWLEAARKRLEAKQALDVVAAEARYKSLLYA